MPSKHWVGSSNLSGRTIINSIEQYIKQKVLYAGSNPVEGTERRINEKNTINVGMFGVERV